VDNDDDYLAIVLQEIAERFALKSEASETESDLAAADVEIELASMYQSAGDREDAVKSEASKDKIAVELQPQTESGLQVEIPRTAAPRSSCCEITTDASVPDSTPGMGSSTVYSGNQVALTVLQQLAPCSPARHG